MSSVAFVFSSMWVVSFFPALFLLELAIAVDHFCSHTGCNGLPSVSFSLKLSLQKLALPEDRRVQSSGGLGLHTMAPWSGAKMIRGEKGNRVAPFSAPEFVAQNTSPSRGRNMEGDSGLWGSKMLAGEVSSDSMMRFKQIELENQMLRNKV